MILNIFFYEHIKIIFEQKIALIVQKIIGVSRFGIEDIRKKVKIESFTEQFGFGGF